MIESLLIGASAQDAGAPFPAYPHLPTPKTCVELKRISSHSAGAHIVSFAVHDRSATFEVSRDLADSDVWAVVSLDGQTPVLARFTEDRLRFGFADLSAGPHALYASIVIRRDDAAVPGAAEVHCFTVSP